MKLSQLEANATDYYWVSPRIIVACTAAAVSVTCIAIKTGIILWRDFSTGFISCMLSVTLVQGGIGGTDGCILIHTVMHTDCYDDAY